VARAPEEERAALFAGNEANELRARWDSIQVGFVDEPRKAVQEADALVSSTIKRLSEVFANERQNLEQQWGRNDNVSTEDLRVIAKIPLVFLAASCNLELSFIRNAALPSGPRASRVARG
jgi:hypothetical protein